MEPGSACQKDRLQVFLGTLLGFYGLGAGKEIKVFLPSALGTKMMLSQHNAPMTHVEILFRGCGRGCRSMGLGVYAALGFRVLVG